MGLVHTRGFDPRFFADSPWLWPYRPSLAQFARHEDWPSFEELEQLLEASALRISRAPLKLALAAPKKKKRKRRAEPIALQSLYDVRISELRELPTRKADWHDFFNVLSFVAWPRAKLALHARQARLLRERLPEPVRRLPGARTREQDVLTMFDEGGVVLACLDSEYGRLTQCDVLDAAVADLCKASAVVIAPFGHALAEHIVAGLSCPLAYAHLVPLPSLDLASDELLDVLDRELASALSDSRQFAAPSGVRGLSLEPLTTSVSFVQKLVPS
jgi:hypothetical protein